MKGFLPKGTVLKVDVLYVGPESILFAVVRVHFSARNLYRRGQ